MGGSSMFQSATYSTLDLPAQYHGNPLIECLPLISDPKAVINKLIAKPNLNLTLSRKSPVHIRVHDVEELETLFVPEPALAVFESDIGILLRRGLKRRHPFSADTQRYLDGLREQMRIQHGFENPLAGIYLVTGISGRGKTRGIRAVLSTYPVAVRHESYKSKSFLQTQVVWMSIDAPVSGSIRGLLLRLFAALDKALGLSGPNSYFSQYARSRLSYDVQIELFAQAAATHFVGVIHIDDLQRVWEANKNQRDLIYAFIIQLSNVARIPLVLSGTHKMTRLLALSIETARRSASSGSLDLSLPTNSKDKFFVALVTALFKYQWVEKPLLLDENLCEKIFWWTQGVTAVVVALYIRSQKIALREGGETFSINHLQQAYRSMEVLHPALAALRSRDKHRLTRYQDLLPSRIQMNKVLTEDAGEKFDTAALLAAVAQEF